MSKLQKNQFKDSSITTQKVEDLQLVDSDINDQADIQQSKVHNLPQDIGSKVNRSGDTMAGFLTLSRNAEVNEELTTKQYVDNALPPGLIISAIWPIIFINTNQARIGYHYLVHKNSTIQTSNVNTILSFDSANIEGNSAPLNSTHYFLYATGTGFIWSTTAPTSYKLHPTQDWLYLAWSVTNGSGQLLPLKKHKKQVVFSQRQILLTTNSQPTMSPITVSPLVPPLDNIQANISLFFGLGGTQSGLTIFYSNPTDSNGTAFIPYAVYNGSQAGYTYNTPRSIIPLDSSYKFYFTKTGGQTITVYINGFMEN
jgi:hypothetical protein